MAAELRRLGVEVIDADQLAREVVEPGEAAFDEIVARFGDQVVGPDGRIDRKALGQVVFSDRSARAELEAITHPMIALSAQRQFRELARRGELMAVYEVPLLVEAGMMPWFDRVVVVAAQRETQLQRLRERDGLSQTEAEARLRAQMSTEEKVQVADEVVWNDGSVEQLRRAIEALHERLLELARERRGKKMAKSKGPLTLVTGLPQYTTRRLVEELAEADPEGRFALLVPERARETIDPWLRALPGSADRFRLLEGEVRRMDLGLSGNEFNELAAEVEVIHHGAAVFHLGVDPEVAEAVNVRGTEEVIELARHASGLRQLVYYSTVGVSGDFRGVWTEDDYDRGQRFNTHYELTKFRAEGLLRREPGLPLTVLRSPVIVGDSATGEIDRFDGPYQLMLLFIVLPVDLGLPLPGRATRLVNIVPVDYFARAARLLSSHPEALGCTFHIVDPEPLTMARVFELVAMASERKVPSAYIPARLSRTLMRTPGLERFAESPVAALDLFTTDVIYSAVRARELLRESGLECPRFPDYVENLVAFLRQKLEREAARRGEEEIYDPLW